MLFFRAARARPRLALLLAAALLFAAHLGLQHRVAHAFEQVDERSSISKTALHSCAALDAATLAACLPGATPALAPDRQRPPAMAAPAPAAPARSFTPPFSARAPPFM